MAITKRGRDTYLIRVYQGRDAVTGKREEVNTTVRGTLAFAKKKEAQLKAQKESGHLIRTARMPLNLLLDLYLASIRHTLSESTQHKYKSYLEYYVRPYMGGIPLTKVNTGNIQELFNFLLDKNRADNTSNSVVKSGGMGLTPNTVKIVRNALKAAFIFAVDEKLVAENPVSKTKLPPIRESRANSLTVEDAKAFVSVKDDFWYGDAFVFQLLTGLRPQELMALIWEDVDFEHGTLRIERACKWVRGACTGFGPTKSKRSGRIISLPSDDLDLLLSHLEKQQKVIEECRVAGSPYGEEKLKEWVRRERPNQSYLYASARLIFPKLDGSVPTIVTPRKEFKAMLELAGISTSIRWYDLRHTHASILLALNVPQHEVAERMGHSVAVLNNIYAHVLPARRSSGPELFAKLIPVKTDYTQSDKCACHAESMTRGEELSDEQWAIIQPHLNELPCIEDGCGRPRQENREIMNGILWVLRSGAGWQDLPGRFPPYQTCHLRFHQWVKDRTLRRVLEALAEHLRTRGDINFSEEFIDGMFVVAKKGGGQSVRSSGVKARNLWWWQTLMVFLSPPTRSVLRRMKSPLFETLFRRDPGDS